MENETYIPAKLYDADGDLLAQWFVFYSYRSPAGKMKRKKVYDNLNSFKTKGERRARARVMIDGINDLLRKGWTPENMELRHQIIPALKDAYQTKVNTLRDRSADSYRSVMSIFCTWLVEAGKDQMFLHAFTKKEGREWLRWLSSTKGVSNRTVNGYHSHIQALFSVLVDMERIPANPFHGIKRLRATRNVQYLPFTDDEAKKLMAYMEANAPALAVFCRLIYFCGIRPKEICTLLVGDVDLKRARIRISAQNAKGKDSGYVKISAAFLPTLRAYLDGHSPGEFLFIKLPDDTLGPGLAEKPIWRNRISERFTDVKRACGIAPEKSLYSWKHYGAIKALEAGATVADIREQFRHKSVAETELYLREGLGMKSRSGYADNIPDV